VNLALVNLSEFKLISACIGVRANIFKGFKGVFFEVFAEEGDFCDEVVGRRDDLVAMASHWIGIKSSRWLPPP